VILQLGHKMRFSAGSGVEKIRLKMLSNEQVRSIAEIREEIGRQ
jgi:hypothetical protein